MTDEDVSYSPSSEYDIRKSIVETMSDWDMREIIKSKELEQKAIRPSVAEMQAVSHFASLLGVPDDFAQSTYLSILSEDCRNCIDLLDKEIKKRSYSNRTNRVDLEELKQSVSIVDVASHY